MWNFDAHPDGGANLAVIFAKGGRVGGWSLLYVKEGLLKYVHNYARISECPVVGIKPLPSGRTTVRSEFTYEGGEDTRRLVYPVSAKQPDADHR